MEAFLYLLIVFLYLIPVWKGIKFFRKYNYFYLWYSVFLILYTYLFSGLIYILVLITNTLGKYNYIHDLLMSCLYGSFFIAFSFVFILPVFVIILFIFNRKKNKQTDGNL
jgi:hypothetical protein